ncbi:TonB-like protein [Mesonia algae]|uniref:TonB-like protein n=1 Tax=Mesonia algae TaxID=213248 RepID=A0A2W7I185_9FLAO|nr:energy transducer TonB [Mesonia algae]PZW39025.1 TonB-like protein [Mesonia algae]
MRIIIGTLLTILLLISCQSKDKSEPKLELKSESKSSITQSEFKKIETNNSLELEYQILDENDEILEFNRLHKMAEYPGGFDSLATFIQRNFKFPETTKNITIKGTVRTTFSVDTLGKVAEVKVIDGLMKEIDQSCIKVISKLPDWKPAELSENKKVKMVFGLPLKFVAEKDTE